MFRLILILIIYWNGGVQKKKIQYKNEVRDCILDPTRGFLFFIGYFCIILLYFFGIKFVINNYELVYRFVNAMFFEYIIFYIDIPFILETLFGYEIIFPVDKVDLIDGGHHIINMYGIPDQVYFENRVMRLFLLQTIGMTCIVLYIVTGVMLRAFGSRVGRPQLYGWFLDLNDKFDEVGNQINDSYRD